MYLSSSGTVEASLAFPRILGDVGGTNARFAIQRGPRTALERVEKLACDDFADFSDALSHYRALIDVPVKAAAFGIANPVNGPDLRMTNHPWAFSIEAVRRAQTLEALLFLNDFTALSLGLEGIREGEVTQIGGGPGQPGAAYAILGPGTGLGVSGSIAVSPDGPRIAISGEGGHVSLAAGNDEEAVLLSQLRRQFGHVSAERVLSGAGLVLLHQVICGQADPGAAAKGVTEPAQLLSLAAEQDPHAQAAVRQFAQFLASVAGDLALTLGARGGVYLAGGISPRIQSYLLEPAFRQRFEAKGRFKSYLAEIPIWLIHDALEPALLGASEALTRQLAQTPVCKNQ